MSDFLFYAGGCILCGVAVAMIAAAMWVPIWHARKIAAHWRDVEDRQRREREAANAPAFCKHCSALLPKSAGAVRYCQRCGKPPDGSASETVEIPPIKALFFSE